MKTNSRQMSPTLPTRKINASPRKNNPTTNFLISIQHTENHSWQGSVQWLDTSEKIHFRSELELMMLINQAVTDQRSTQETTQLSDQPRTWSQPMSEAK